MPAKALLRKFSATYVDLTRNSGVINKSKNRGMTLLELMIALTIASVILTLGVPSFRAVIDNQRMTASTNEMVMTLNLAKSEAIKRVAYVSICQSSDGASCSAGGLGWQDGWIVFANATNASLDSFDAGDELIRVYPRLRQSFTFTSLGAINSFVSFRPGGTIGTSAANMTGTLTICDERGAGYARGIVLGLSGRWHVSYEEAHDGSVLVCP